ncbi:hypothetical protein GGF43_004019, partial [Coemansia sp. RSA 2618]
LSSKLGVASLSASESSAVGSSSGSVSSSFESSVFASSVALSPESDFFCDVSSLLGVGVGVSFVSSFVPLGDESAATLKNNK